MPNALGNGLTGGWLEGKRILERLWLGQVAKDKQLSQDSGRGNREQKYVSKIVESLAGSLLCHRLYSGRGGRKTDERSFKLDGDLGLENGFTEHQRKWGWRGSRFACLGYGGNGRGKNVARSDE